MKNLAAVITKSNVIIALEKALKEKPGLRKATKFLLKYKNEFFPPKEVVRLAAIEQGIKKKDFHLYWLNGGLPTNKHLEKLGFEIIKYADWKLQKEPSKEKRVARICWNKFGWVYPSGKEGKSIYKDSHEFKYGYGHEEWLFDVGKTINGYHYGFLEPVRKQQEAYVSKIYDIWLYTIDFKTKKRYWAGELFNVEILSKEEAEEIKNIYIKKGWLDFMTEQIRASGANPKGFSNYKGVDLFNIRFLPNAVKLNDPYYELPQNHPIVRQSRYSFGHFKDSFNLPEEDNATFKFIPPDFKQRKIESNGLKTGIHIREEKTVEISYLHTAISKQLTIFLRNKYGERNVTPEHPAGYGDNRVDIVVNLGKSTTFYEIKTYPSLKTSIRQALGQLIEYSMWTNYYKAKELIIITQPHMDLEKAKIYIKHLRNTFGIPLYYQSFDVETNQLSEKL